MVYLGTIAVAILVVGLVGVGVAALLAKFKRPAYAVYRRNLISYFSHPTGYAFICLFVALSSIAAFWPNDFFSNNLATLDQLNIYLPLIMLVFIPAITMGIWAEERRQGTDELVLTIPAADLDIVLGKYLAALSIFTASLLFSFIANLIVLATLGEPDVGLFVSTNFGYWLAGAAMLAIGMAASFLTSNLTVAFIVGALFCLPLVFLMYADVIFSPEYAVMLQQWSIGGQMADLARGVISLKTLVYFGGLVSVMLYISLVLIGRRHWLGGRDGNAMLPHYLGRGLALFATVAAAVIVVDQVFALRRLRWDLSSAQLSALTDGTRTILADLRGSEETRPVRIEAYVSPQVPDAFVTTKLNLVNTLEELAALGGAKIDLRVHEVEPFGPEAASAEKRYGIKPREVESTVRGVYSTSEILLAVAMTSGVEKVVIPFIDRGVPIEYELVRALGTVTQQKRKKIGVISPEFNLFMYSDPRPGGEPKHPLIKELERQYELVPVDAATAIGDDYAALLALQPSALNAPAMTNLIAAVKRGVPTAIFEDPKPVFTPVTPTGRPKSPQQSPFGQFTPPESKAEIAPLWEYLGLTFLSHEVVYQDNYFPYPKAADRFDRIREFLVFVGPGQKDQSEPFNAQDPVTRSLHEVVFPFPGAVLEQKREGLSFEPLVVTGTATGTMWESNVNPGGRAWDIESRHRDPDTNAGAAFDPFSGGGGGPRTKQGKRGTAFTLAARIHGQVKDPSWPSDQKRKETHVIVVADVDCVSDQLFFIRDAGHTPEMGIDWRFENVAFVLNVLDRLTGDDRYFDVRSRLPDYRTLSTIETQTRAAQDNANAEQRRFRDELKKAVDDEQAALDERIKKIRDREGVSKATAEIESLAALKEGTERLALRRELLQQEMQGKIRTIDNALKEEVRGVQEWYKLWSVLLPPIFPALVAVGFFFHRRQGEREGVARGRLR